MERNSNENPYVSSKTSGNSISRIQAYKHIAFIVALLGAIGPLLYGLYLIWSVWSQPTPGPGEANDGTPAVAGLVFIFVIGPVIGVILYVFVRLLGPVASWRKIKDEDSK